MAINYVRSNDSLFDSKYQQASTAKKTYGGAQRRGLAINTKLLPKAKYTKSFFPQPDKLIEIVPKGLSNAEKVINEMVVPIPAGGGSVPMSEPGDLGVIIGNPLDPGEIIYPTTLYFTSSRHYLCDVLIFGVPGAGGGGGGGTAGQVVEGVTITPDALAPVGGSTNCFPTYAGGDGGNGGGAGGNGSFPSPAYKYLKDVEYQPLDVVEFTIGNKTTGGSGGDGDVYEQKRDGDKTQDATSGSVGGTGTTVGLRIGDTYLTIAGGEGGGAGLVGQGGAGGSNINLRPITVHDIFTTNPYANGKFTIVRHLIDISTGEETITNHEIPVTPSSVTTDAKVRSGLDETAFYVRAHTFPAVLSDPEVTLWAYADLSSYASTQGLPGGYPGYPISVDIMQFKTSAALKWGYMTKKGDNTGLYEFYVYAEEPSTNYDMLFIDDAQDPMPGGNPADPIQPPKNGDQTRALCPAEVSSFEKINSAGSLSRVALAKKPREMQLSIPYKNPEELWTSRTSSERQKLIDMGIPVDDQELNNVYVLKMAFPTLVCGLGGPGGFGGTGGQGYILWPPGGGSATYEQALTYSAYQWVPFKHYRYAPGNGVPLGTSTLTNGSQGQSSSGGRVYMFNLREVTT